MESRESGEKLRISSCPGRDKENVIPLCLRVLVIGRQGNGLHDLSESLGTRVPFPSCGLLHPTGDIDLAGMLVRYPAP